MNEGYLEMTIPDKPNSPNQQYRLTVKGQELKKRLEARQ
jgi:DNA-binding HxlR family transcriptional regulator